MNTICKVLLILCITVVLIIIILCATNDVDATTSQTFPLSKSNITLTDDDVDVDDKTHKNDDTERKSRHVVSTTPDTIHTTKSSCSCCTLPKKKKKNKNETAVNVDKKQQHINNEKSDKEEGLADDDIEFVELHDDIKTKINFNSSYYRIVQ